MTKYKSLAAFLLLFCWSAASNAQQFKRQVISSLGTNHILVPGNPVTCTAITVGQPPNAGTISNGVSTLRQGFQQPSLDNCAINISFEKQETSLQGCGTYYTFEYTGDIDPTTEISWQFGDLASPAIATGPITPLIGFTEVGPQTIMITVSNQECQKTMSKIIIATGTPFLALNTKEDALCYGDRGTINLTIKNGKAPIVYAWSSGQTTKDIQNLLPGDYTYSVVDANGCTATETVTINGSTQPLLVDSHVLDEICKDTKDGSIELMVLNAASPVTFTWENGFVGEKLDSLTKGTYKVTIEDANGCKIDSSFNIRSFCELTEKDLIPDVFTPNGDGFNDTWNIDMLERFPDHTVQIFNRWGGLIWEAPVGAFAGWPGVNTKGEELPIGAYFYYIDLKDVSNKTFKGSVTIIK